MESLQSEVDVNAALIRVLLAEDHEPFRRFLVSEMQGTLEMVIYEVADGIDALQKAGELQPELILMDIGLPRLSGIEAARQIRALSPNSKILFVSQESSVDIVQAALETGALGYLRKTDAGLELIPALDAVLRGQRYLSRSVAGAASTGSSDESPSDTVEEYPAKAHPQGHRNENARRHEVGFHSDDRSLLESFTNFVGAALKNGDAAIVMATELHRNKLLSGLQVYGLDMSTAIEQGRYVALDNAAAVAEILVNNRPDRSRFYRVTDDLILRTAKSVDGEPARIVACGECAPYLWGQGNAEGAVRLEHLWDEIAKTYGVQVLCGYPLASFQGGSGSYTFGRICAEHSAVLSL